MSLDATFPAGLGLSLRLLSFVLSLGLQAFGTLDCFGLRALSLFPALLFARPVRVAPAPTLQPAPPADCCALSSASA